MGMLATIKNIPKAIAASGGKLAFKLSKNKPQIMVYGGIMIATGAFIWGIANAMKLSDQQKISEAKMDEIENRKLMAENPESEMTSDERTIILANYEKDIRKVKTDAAWMLFKMIGVPSLMFIGGMSLSFGGHIILVKRFGELSTAFATLQESYRRYREANIREHGEDCDRRYRYGIVGETEVTQEVTDDKGKTKKVKCKVPIVDRDVAASMYSFEFSENFSSKCPKDPVRMISFLRSQEVFWNTWMETKQKPVTLYMVLNDLGIDLDPDDPRNDYVMLAGWRPNGDGDNHIDFGIMRAVNKPALDMLENVCFLDFNCDGNLYHSPRYTKEGLRVCG